MKSFAFPLAVDLTKRLLLAAGVLGVTAAPGENLCVGKPAVPVTMAFSSSLLSSLPSLPPLASALSSSASLQPAVPSYRVAMAEEHQTVHMPILTYHYVEVVQNRRDRLRIAMAVEPSALDRQLDSLDQNGMQTYQVRDVAEMIAGRSPIPLKGVVLTFDDGYSDFYTDAFPLLLKHRARCTFYIVNDFIGKPGYVTEDQLREIIDSGLVEIGSHTLDHPNLTSLSLAEATRQIVQSKKGLEDKFGIKVETFAYPYGRFNSQIEQIVKDAGFTAAVSEIGGKTQSDKNIFALSRIHAGAFLGKKMLGAL